MSWRKTSPSFRALLAAIAAVGALHGLAYTPFVSTHYGTDSRTYRAAAESLREGGYTTPLQEGFYFTYGVGFFDITGVRIDREAWDAPERQAFRPPGYPLFLAALGGGGEGISLTVVLVAQALLFGGGVFLLGLAVARWWGTKTALVAAALFAVDPYSKHYVSLVLTEALAGFLVVAGVYALTRAWHGRSAAWWAAVGTIAAALTLVRAVFVLAIPLLVIGALARRADVRSRLARAAAAAACAGVLLAPWLVWTASVTGRPVLANWGEGYNVLVAAHGEGFGRTTTDVAEDPDFLRDFTAPHRLAPSTGELLRDPEAHPRYMTEADAILRRLARSRYSERLRDEPLSVLGETGYRAAFLWTAHEDWYQPGGLLLLLMQIADWLTLLVAGIGIALAVRSGGAARATALFVLAYTAVLATHHMEARFGIPLRGLLFAYVAFAAVTALTAPALGGRRRATLPRGGTRTARTAESPGSRPTSCTTA